MVSGFKILGYLCVFLLGISHNKFGWLVVMFFRFVTSGEIRKRSEFFEPFILGLTNATVEQVCFNIIKKIVCSEVLGILSCI